MKKISLVLSIALVLVMIFAAGCSKSSSSSSPTTPTGGSSKLLINGAVTISSSIPGAVFQLYDMTSGSPVVISTATVTVNTQSLTYSSGIYSNSSPLTGITAGTAITVVITTSLGNATYTGTMPASGAATVFLSTTSSVCIGSTVGAENS